MWPGQVSLNSWPDETGLRDKVWRGKISSKNWLTGYGCWLDIYHLPLVDWMDSYHIQPTDRYVFFHQPHPTIQRPEASQGDCVSAEIDAWAFAGRWESVVCMKAWTLQAYKTPKSIQIQPSKSQTDHVVFLWKWGVSLNPTTSFRLVWRRHFAFLATWGLSTSEVDLLKGQGVAPPEIPGFFRGSHSMQREAQRI